MRLCLKFRIVFLFSQYGYWILIKYALHDIQRSITEMINLMCINIAFSEITILLLFFWRISIVIKN